MALLSNTSSELPDFLTQNSTKVYQKGRKSLFFSGKMTSENSEVVFFLGVGRSLSRVVNGLLLGVFKLSNLPVADTFPLCIWSENLF